MEGTHYDYFTGTAGTPLATHDANWTYSGGGWEIEYLRIGSSNNVGTTELAQTAVLYALCTSDVSRITVLANQAADSAT